MRGSVLTASCTVLLAATLCAQSTDQLFRFFGDAVRDYQRGNVESAAGALEGWPRRDFERAASAVIGSRDWPLVRAAAMLHTELALRQAFANIPAVAFHIGLAEALVQASPPAQAVEFHRRWYTAAVSILLSRTIAKDARSLVDRGLRLFPKDAPLHLLSGVTEETLAHLEDPECTGPGCDTRGPRSGARLMLTHAEEHYRRALDLDAELVEARLRLGRVLFLANQRSRARQELTAVAQKPVGARFQYLAHLFLGGLADYENDFAAARREYETALSLAPEHQTPYLALSFAEQMTGAVAKARETVSAMIGRPRTDITDPWLDYQNGAGRSADGLEWLRKEVRW